MNLLFKNLKKVTAIATAVIALIVIILGCTLLSDADSHYTDNDSFRYSADYYNADGASFGADFYTYVYNASDIIVDELNDINSAMSVVVDAQNTISKNVAAGVDATDDLADVVGKVGGVVTIAIGLAILANALQCASVAFAPAGKEEITDAEPAAVIEE